MGEAWLIESLIFMAWCCCLFVCWIAANEEIGDDGARHILHGLERNTSLTQLEIGEIWGAFLYFIVHLLWRLSCMLESL
jgi:hypothetical protein